MYNIYHALPTYLYKYKTTKNGHNIKLWKRYEETQQNSDFSQINFNIFLKYGMSNYVKNIWCLCFAKIFLRLLSRVIHHPVLLRETEAYVILLSIMKMHTLSEVFWFFFLTSTHSLLGVTFWKFKLLGSKGF
jgi:hypothetical protein